MNVNGCRESRHCKLHFPEVLIKLKIFIGRNIDRNFNIPFDKRYNIRRKNLFRHYFLNCIIINFLKKSTLKSETFICITKRNK